MKKRFLIIVCLFLSLANNTFAAQGQSETMPTEIKQKACQNIFSFINIDLSVMSPRGSATDVNISDVKSDSCKKSEIVPIANKTEVKPTIETTKNKTSLFRLDLLHIIKIQIQ